MKTVWVCNACGKRSHDRLGEKPIDRGWDASCFMHAVECTVDSLKFGINGRVLEAQPATEAK